MISDMKSAVLGLMMAGYLLYGTGVIAQENDEPRYLLTGRDGKVHVSGFGAPIVGFSSVEGNFAVYNGGGGAVLLNQTFYAGVYGMGLSTEHSRDEFTLLNSQNQKITYTDLHTNFGHGGFWLGYIHKPERAVHFAASTKLGWGSIALTEQEYGVDKYDNVVTDNVFVVNPQLEVEMNLLRWFKMNIGAGYQFVTGVDKTYKDISGNRVRFFDAADFSQPQLTVSLLFGGFGGVK